MLEQPARGREDAYAETAKQQLSLFRIGGINSFKELAEIHARYNATVRAVGAELDVPMIDMEGVYRRTAAAHTFTAVDAIHPTDEGYGLEADALHAQLRRIGAVGPQARLELQRARMH